MTFTPNSPLSQPEPILNASYHCSACKRTHNTASKIGRAHKFFANKSEPKSEPQSEPKHIRELFRDNYPGGMQKGED
jgi:hypothetical protein